MAPQTTTTHTPDHTHHNDNDNDNDESLLTTAHTILTTHLLPPPHIQSTILTTILSHPYWTTFLLAQFVCSFIPIALFLFGAVVAASVAVAAFTCLAGIVLIPVLVGTTVLGVGVWGCGWAVLILGKWAWGVFLAADSGEGYNLFDGLNRYGVSTKEKGGYGKVYGNGVQNGVGDHGGVE